MKSEWKESTIEQVCALVTDGAHYSPPSVESGEYMVSVKDFTAYGFDFTACRKISKEEYNKLYEAGCVPQKNDILVGKDGARFFEDIILYKQEEKPALLSSIAILRVDENQIFPAYFYYYLKSPDVKKDVRDNYGSGSAIPRVVLRDFKRMPIFYPPLPIQRKIASILSALDDKIEANNAICRNLEEQARALYELWLSKRKNECEWLSLEAIADLNPEAYSIKEKWGYINYLDTGNITDGVISSIQKIDLDQDELPSRARRKVKAGDVVFSTVRPNQRHFGILHSPLPNMLVSTGFTVIRSNKTDISNELIYLLLSDSSFVEKMQQIGEQSVSAYPSVKPTDIATCQIPFMDSMDYFQMQKVICAMFSQSAVLKDVNRYLSDMRDTLLPKLMNGEIDLGKLGKLA